MRKFAASLAYLRKTCCNRGMVCCTCLGKWVLVMAACTVVLGVGERPSFAAPTEPTAKTSKTKKSTAKKSTAKVTDPCDPTYVAPRGQFAAPCTSVTTLALRPTSSRSTSSGAASSAQTKPPARPVSPASIKASADGSGRVIVEAPGFRMMPDGSSRLVVQMQGTPQVRQHTMRRRITYVLSNAKVPVNNNRNPLFTRYFNTPVNDARLRQYRGDVLFEIDLRADAVANSQFTQAPTGQGTVLEVTFAPGDYERLIPPDGRKRSKAPSRQAPSAGGRAQGGSSGARVPSSSPPRVGPAVP